MTESDGVDELVWRMVAFRGKERVEVEGEGVFDELVVGRWLHLEKMDDDLWWLRIGDARVMVALVPGSEPTVDISRAFYGPERGGSTVFAPSAHRESDGEEGIR